MNKATQILTLSAILIVLTMVPAIDGKITGKHNSSGGCSCHNSGSAPTVNHNFPSSYTPGQTYSIQVSATGGISGTDGGFSLSVNKGSYSNAGTGVSFSGNSATHSNANSRSWSFDWTAPAQGSGTVSVSVAVLTANGNGQSGGDSWNTGTASITEILVQNEIPVASNVQINSASGNYESTEDLTVSYSYSDADNDPESGTMIRWLKNGVAQSSYNDMTTLPSSATSFGENWAVKVTPSDGTDTGATVQSQDVTISDVDSDMDGVLDGDDAFPNDPNETTDSDSDGVGDNADQFPNDPNETTDSDSDGVGDNSDAFPNDPT